MADNKTPDKWEDYVRSEVNSLLDLYLPESINGNVGIKYIHPVKEELETGPVYYDDRICGVVINLVFNFDQDFEIQK